MSHGTYGSVPRELLSQAQVRAQPRAQAFPSRSLVTTFPGLFLKRKPGAFSICMEKPGRIFFLPNRTVQLFH